MMIGFMASLGLPGLVGFIAEFSVFTATYNIFDLWVLIPVMSVAITAAYYIWAMQRTIFGDLTTKIDTKHIHDSYWFETVPLAVLIGLIALFGIFPSLLMDIILPSVAPLAAVI
jgi:NADH-quinone oxidoreductase subunit M